MRADDKRRTIISDEAATGCGCMSSRFAPPNLARRIVEGNTSSVNKSDNSIGEAARGGDDDAVRDVFISYASDDRHVAQPLAEALRASGISVWFDEFELLIGDSLRRSIEQGLRISRHGVVILSHAFFAKNWPQQELAALTALQKKILPIWHELTVEEVKQYSPLLADVRAAKTSWDSERLVAEIRRAIGENTAQAGGGPEAGTPIRSRRAATAGDRLYEEHAMLISTTGRGEPAVRAVVRFPGDAARLIPGEVSAVMNHVGQQYLNVYNVGLQLAARSSQHIDFETPRTADDRHIMLQVLQEGVLDIGIYHAWTADRGVPWDWLTGELYTLYLFLNDDRMRSLFGGTGDIRVVAKLAALENAEAALVTASGMAAISTTLLAFLSAGDHLLAQDCLYGGTHDFLTKDFRGFGLAYDFIDGDDPASWRAKLRPRTKLIYVEAITNPLMQVADLRGVVEFAKSHGLVSIIDNTFATPVNFRPIDWGFDLSIHSGTKYLNGHSDIVAGAIAGGADSIDRIKRKLDHLGGSLDPHAAFLLHRGMKTLAVRLRHQNESALKIARYLEGNPAVAKVNYPGLEGQPRHRRAKELFDGFGGMLSFELKGGVQAARLFVQNAALPIKAPSLGGVESLLTQPALTSHAGMSREDRQRLGISDGLIRMSVGLEAMEELIEDLEQALTVSYAAVRTA